MNLKTIAFVEDDELDFELFGQIIDSFGHDLKVVNLHPVTAEKVDQLDPSSTIIFLDLKIKNTRGYEIYQSFLKEKKFITYYLTSSDDPNDVDRCSIVGGNGYLQKFENVSSNRRQLKNVIEHWLDFNLIKQNMFEPDDQKKLKDENQNLKSRIEYLENESMQSLKSDEGDELISSIYNVLETGLYIFDIEKQRNIYINKIYESTTGYNLDDLDLLGSSDFLNLFHPDDLEKLERHIEKIYSSKNDSVFYLEYRFLHKNKKWIKLLSVDRVYERNDQQIPIKFLGCIYII